MTKINREAIKRQLTATGSEQQKLFAQAVSVRNDTLGNKVNVRGVIELSNRCVENCLYCAMRRDNPALGRYTLDQQAVLSAAQAIIQAGIPTVFLQCGESPENNRLLESVIPQIYEAHRCAIILCAGKARPEAYTRYKNAGTEGYILKFEAANPMLYESVTQAHHTKRLYCIQSIRHAGLKLGTGSIVGLPGQTLDDLVDDVLLAIETAPDYVSVSPFIPNNGTPYESLPSGDINLTLNMMAIWRSALPHALIPTVSALEYIHPDGQAAGLNAGANVVTINFTPKQSRDQYAIYAKDRFIVSLDHAYKTAEKARMVLHVVG
jgi:biotin synthase